MTPTAASQTAAALLTADPPEIADIRAACGWAHMAGHSIVHLKLDTLTEVLATVDYLRDQLAGAREALAIVTDDRDALAAQIDTARNLCARSPLCVPALGGEG